MGRALRPWERRRTELREGRLWTGSRKMQTSQASCAANGATTSAAAFLNVSTIKIVVLGLAAFIFGTAGGMWLGQLLKKVTNGRINPLIGSAGVSAVPMAARVSQKVGSEADPTNFLLMHAMGPNVAGVIGSGVAAGVMLCMYGGY